jgi:hypothetical protein
MDRVHLGPGLDRPNRLVAHRGARLARRRRTNLFSSYSTPDARRATGRMHLSVRRRALCKFAALAPSRRARGGRGMCPGAAEVHL